jgi:hypothetical protein
MKRSVTPELLDTDAGTSAEIRSGLRDLWRINSWFGGVSTSAAMVRKVAQVSGRRELRMLDVAAGSGDVPVAVRDRLKADGIVLRILLLDRAVTHLSGNRNAIVANALAIPLRDNSVDLVTSSLFLHHLEPAEVVHFVNEALRVCRIGVAINDLRRSRLHLAAAYAGLPLFSRLTRHDALASVRRAYTVSELHSILGKTQANGIAIDRHYLFRMGAIAWK